MEVELKPDDSVTDVLDRAVQDGVVKTIEWHELLGWELKDSRTGQVWQHTVCPRLSKLQPPLNEDSVLTFTRWTPPLSVMWRVWDQESSSCPLDKVRSLEELRAAIRRQLGWTAEQLFSLYAFPTFRQTEHYKIDSDELLAHWYQKAVFYVFKLMGNKRRERPLKDRHGLPLRVQTLSPEPIALVCASATAASQCSPSVREGTLSRDYDGQLSYCVFCGQRDLPGLLEVAPLIPHSEAERLELELPQALQYEIGNEQTAFNAVTAC